MTSSRWRVLAAVAAVAACAAPTITPSPPPTEMSPPADPQASGVQEAAAADLAGRLGVDRAAIEVMVAEPVTWPDGSLGCPQPGRLYTQALVDGYRVVLRAGDRVYDYHAGSDGVPFLCPSPDEGPGREFVPPPGYDE
jgi:hypothetical protein